jgi:hypothetical protein
MAKLVYNAIVKTDFYGQPDFKKYRNITNVKGFTAWCERNYKIKTIWFYYASDQAYCGYYSAYHRVFMPPNSSFTKRR